MTSLGYHMGESNGLTQVAWLVHWNQFNNVKQVKSEFDNDFRKYFYFF